MPWPAVDRAFPHDLAVVGRQRAGDLHRLDAVRAAQRPPAEILVALADDDAVVVPELCSSFVCSASSSMAVIAGDRIGREVVPEGLRVLEAAARRYGIELAFTPSEWPDCDH
jgi:hypothetical protein